MWQRVEATGTAPFVMFLHMKIMKSWPVVDYTQMCSGNVAGIEGPPRRSGEGRDSLWSVLRRDQLHPSRLLQREHETEECLIPDSLSGLSPCGDATSS